MGTKSRKKLTGEGRRPGDHCVPVILYTESLTLLFSETGQRAPGLKTEGVRAPGRAGGGQGEAVAWEQETISQGPAVLPPPWVTFFPPSTQEGALSRLLCNREGPGCLTRVSWNFPSWEDSRIFP